MKFPLIKIVHQQFVGCLCYLCNNNFVIDMILEVLYIGLYFGCYFVLPQIKYILRNELVQPIDRIYRIVQIFPYMQLILIDINRIYFFTFIRKTPLGIFFREIGTDGIASLTRFPV